MASLVVVITVGDAVVGVSVVVVAVGDEVTEVGLG